MAVCIRQPLWAGTVQMPLATSKEMAYSFGELETSLREVTQLCVEHSVN